jgi:hypothetical protein
MLFILVNLLHQAFPTRALKNELCHSFIINRCWKANNCSRIHPYDKRLYRCQAFELKRLRDLKLNQAQSLSPENVPVPEPIMTTAPTNPISQQPAQPQPKATTKTSRRQSEGPSANTETNRASVVGLTGNLQQCPVQPAENKNHTVSAESIKSGEDVQNWDTLHDNRLSDTSSISEDLSVPGRWDPDTGFWENYTDYKSWSDDSDVTTDDMQTSSEGTGGRIPPSVPPSPTQVLPMKEQKHPRPKYNERCRRWLWNECNLGYQCKFVHEDLEYDDAPVSIDSSLCNHSFFMSVF